MAKLNGFKLHFLLMMIGIILFMLSTMTKSVDGRKIHSQVYKDDDIKVLIKEDDVKIKNRSAECVYGKTLRELGSTWFADLGPPFGVMYCIRCECKGINKQNRIVARLECKNIKNECPEPTCDEPILLKGRCCKTCPGDLYSPDIVQDMVPPVTNEEEERSMKHFAALLTGRTSQSLKREEMKSMYSTNNPQNIIATGRFSFHKKNLYYSFYVSEKAKRPRAIQFVDHMGNILEEHSLTIPSNGPFSIYQNSTGKICGVWRRVPRDYRRLLRDDQMNVVLLWGGKYQAELALAGQIGKYPALATELFSSLLEPAPGTSPEQMSGSGGTAIVSTISGVTSSVHVTLVLNGLFNTEDIADVPLNIRLESIEKKQIILEDIQRVKKPAHDVNVIELSEPVSAYQLRLLTRGRLTITVESRKNPDALRIQGNVVTRVACEIFQTVLSSHNAEHHGKSSGLAWIYLNKDGSLVYNVQTENLNMMDNPMITLVDDGVKRKTELEDLTPSLNNNLAIGQLDRLSPRVLEPLYNGDLAINVATEHCLPTLIRGRLNWRPVADARDSPAPVLLKRLESSAPSNMVGMAWIAVDNECNLHYEVTLTRNGNHYQSLQLYLEEIPIEAPGAPVSRKLLEEFNGNYLEGFVLGLSAYELAKLETSVCFLEVHSKDKGEAFLKARLKPTKVPNHCLPLYTDNDVPSLSHSATEHNDNNLPAFESKCYHSGRFFDEGGQWKSGLESCTMCSCVHGRVKCDPIKCPPLRCKSEDHQIIKGECCPSCQTSKYVPETNLTHPRGCQLGDQFYSAGASWHPYLPPNGFDTCAICTCDSTNLEIYCPRIQCPPLKCSEKMAYRPDKKACCKKCPELRAVSSNKTAFNVDTQRDQGLKYSNILTIEEILKNGGCNTSISIHENGQEWHPIIVSLGEQKCIKCRCKDGHITCDRKRCTRSVCNNRITGRKRARQQQQQQQQQHHHQSYQQQQQQQQQHQQIIQEQDECCSHQCGRHHKKRRTKEQHEQKIVSTTTTTNS